LKYESAHGESDVYDCSIFQIPMHYEHMGGGERTSAYNEVWLEDPGRCTACRIYDQQQAASPIRDWQRAATASLHVQTDADGTTRDRAVFARRLPNWLRNSKEQQKTPSLQTQIEGDGGNHKYD